jgi:hypothetical protein
LRVSFKPYVPTLFSGRPLLSGWKTAGVDWHDLVPSSLLSKDELAFRDLVAREESVTRMLQGQNTLQGQSPGCAVRGGCADENDKTTNKIDYLNKLLIEDADTNPWAVASTINGRHGPLAKYAVCGVLRDACAIHASIRGCAEDELCGWCVATKTCVGRTGASLVRAELVASVRVPSCPSHLLVADSSVNPLTITQNDFFYFDTDSLKLDSQPTDKCDVRITRRKPYVVNSPGGNARMAFHFYTENAVCVVYFEFCFTID